MTTRRDVLQMMAMVGAQVTVPTVMGLNEAEAEQANPGKSNNRVQLVRRPIQTFNVRKSEDRGMANHGWLLAKHSFSFANYRDPKHMGFRSLRVMNEDRIQAGRGFPMHPHWDMEILTFILDGALEHKDSIGNGSIIKPGEIQKMSAGSGIRHSEFNPSSDKPVHLLQIWLYPDKRGIKPGYQQQVIPQISSPDPVRLIASPNGANNSVTIQQDARIYACRMSNSQHMHFEVKPTRHVWIQVAKGSVTINKKVLKQGDGFSTSDVGWIFAQANQQSELLVFDLA